MKTPNLRQYSVVALMFFLLGCKSNSILPQPDCNQNANLTHPQPSIVSFTRYQVSDLLPARKEEFKDTLETEIIINDIRNVSQPETGQASTLFDLYVYFHNTSSSDIVLRIPQTVGFISDPNISEGGIYDLTFHLRTEDGEPMGAWNSYEMLDEEIVDLDDFFVLKKEDSLCIHSRLTMPLVFIDSVGHDFLPPNEYSIMAEYENYLIGTVIFPSETPTPDLQGSEYVNWIFSHEKETDLNAWVGRVKSERMSFKIDE